MQITLCKAPQPPQRSFMHTHSKDKFYLQHGIHHAFEKAFFGNNLLTCVKIVGALSTMLLCVKQTLFLGKQASYFTCSSILSCFSWELIFVSQNWKCFSAWSLKQYLPHANVGVDADFFQHFAMHMMCLWNIINNFSTLKNKKKICSTLQG